MNLNFATIFLYTYIVSCTCNVLLWKVRVMFMAYNGCEKGVKTSRASCSRLNMNPDAKENVLVHGD